MRDEAGVQPAAGRSSHLTGSFVRFLISRMAEQQQTITNLITMDSEHRLAATLLRLACKLGKRQPEGVQIAIKITHEDLARMIGTTRSRVGIFLKRFRDSGLVEPLPGSFLMINEPGLITFVQESTEKGAEKFWGMHLIPYPRNTLVGHRTVLGGRRGQRNQDRTDTNTLDLNQGNGKIA